MDVQVSRSTRMCESDPDCVPDPLLKFFPTPLQIVIQRRHLMNHRYNFHHCYLRCSPKSIPYLFRSRCGQSTIGARHWIPGALPPAQFAVAKIKVPGQFRGHLTVAIITSQQKIYDDKAASANFWQRINTRYQIKVRNTLGWRYYWSWRVTFFALCVKVRTSIKTGNLSIQVMRQLKPRLLYTIHWIICTANRADILPVSGKFNCRSQDKPGSHNTYKITLRFSCSNRPSTVNLNLKLTRYLHRILPRLTESDYDSGCAWETQFLISPVMRQYYHFGDWRLSVICWNHPQTF